MQKQGSCNHFQNIKIEQLGNTIKTDFMKCDNTKKLKCEEENEKWLCLGCGFYGCSRNSVNQCAAKHFENSNHPLSISSTSYAIWCYQCDDDMDSISEKCTNNGQKTKIDKFIDSIKQLLFKKIKSNKQSVVIQQQQQSNFQEQNIVQQQINQNENKIQPLNYKPKQVFGLKNLGNTCFFNSVMQCLNGSEALNNYYLNLKQFNFSSYNNNNDDDDDDDEWVTVTKNQNQKQQQNKNQKQRNSINQIYQNFLFNGRRNKDILDPSELFKCIQIIQGRFKSMAQQDASELLRCLLDGLSTGEEQTSIGRINKIKTEGKQKKTIIENIFGSYLCNYLECLECGYISRTFDFCLDYSIQIKKPKGIINNRFNNEYSEITNQDLQGINVPYLGNNILVQKNNNNNIQNNNNQQLNIKDCLNSFTEYEELNSKNNYFKCEKCAKQGKKSGRALRKFFLYDLPQIVTIILKRFQQKSGGRFEKVNEFVEIEETIYLEDYTLLKGESNQNIEEIIQQKFQYKLYGVVVHQGNMQGGHYISYVKHKENNQDHWYYFSDSNFKEVSLKNVLNCQAYILFYERV